MNHSKIVLYSGLAMLIGLPTVSFAEKPLSPEAKKQFEQVIHDYIMEHPDVIRKSVMAEQQKQVKEMMSNAKKIAVTEKDNLFSKMSPNFGAEDPKKIMVMFFDYQCGHCKNVSGTVEELVDANKDMKIVYKELPIFGGTSIVLAKAALASNKQGKYREFHQKLMANKQTIDEEKLMALAKEVGLDTEKLKKDMESSEIENELNANVELAKKLGLQGTPAFFISSYPEVTAEKLQFIPGGASKEQLQTLITEAK